MKEELAKAEKAPGINSSSDGTRCWCRARRNVLIDLIRIFKS